jgi:hypothetical protein
MNRSPLEMTIWYLTDYSRVDNLVKRSGTGRAPPSNAGPRINLRRTDPPDSPALHGYLAHEKYSPPRTLQ